MNRKLERVRALLLEIAKDDSVPVGVRLEFIDALDDLDAGLAEWSDELQARLESARNAYVRNPEFDGDEIGRWDD